MQMSPRVMSPDAMALRMDRSVKSRFLGVKIRSMSWIMVIGSVLVASVKGIL